MQLRRWIAAAGLAATSLAGLSACATTSGPVAAEAPVRTGSENSAAVRATAARGVAADAYADFEGALRAADLDAVITRARKEGAGGVSDGAVATALVMDELAAGQSAAARATLDALPDLYSDGVHNLAEPWLLLVEGDKERAAERAHVAASRLPENLGRVLEALVAEASGDLAGADAIYTALLATMDLAAPGDDEPATLDEVLREIGAAQTAQILYRAAQTKHRLGDREEAARLYGIVKEFARHAPDVDANLARVGKGEPPLEPALDAVRGMGRWALFLSEEFGRTEGLARAIADPSPTKELISPSSVLFNQMGVALDPSAHDWMIGAASVLQGADATEGALRLLERVPRTSVYAADAKLMRAQIELERRRDDVAAAAALGAQEIEPGRWSVALSAGHILSAAGRDAEAVAAASRAVDLAKSKRDKADALITRAGIHYFAGRFDAAAEDGRAAMAADSRADIKIAMIGLLIEAPGGWDEAVQIGRALLAEQPESVSRLNQLGYTLIQRPEGLEEGYRLLKRGSALGQYDFAVTDSLGWAYYQYGDFEQALALIERAIELSPEPIAEILDHLGDVYWRLKLPEDAKRSWREALQARPEAARKKNLEKKLQEGLTTPPPERRKPPALEEFTPGQRQDL